jgi:hypothetical protein
MTTLSCRITVALLFAMPMTVYAEDFTPKQIAAAISRGLGADSASPNFINLGTSPEGPVLLIDENALARQTGINVLGGHLPETIRLRVKQKSGTVLLNDAGFDAYTTKTSTVDGEKGLTSARNYAVSASLVGGVLGMGHFQTDLAGLHYRSDDGTRETTAEGALLSIYKNQRFFSPSTIQMG